MKESKETLEQLEYIAKQLRSIQQDYDGIEVRGLRMFISVMIANHNK